MPINESDKFMFNPSEVVGDDLNVLEYQIPFSAESRLKLGRLAANEANVSVEE